MRKKLHGDYAPVTGHPERIIATLPGYVYWKNAYSEYVRCNKNLARISNLKTCDEIIGKRDEDFGWGKEQAEVFRADDRLVMETGGTKTTEHKLPILQNNQLINIHVRTEKTPLYNKQGKIIGVLGVALDVTELLTKENVHKFDETLFTSLRVIAETPLTTRETQCVCLWLSGYSVKYTSKVLSISNKTVETYRANILSKLGLFNKDQLISLVMAENTFYQYVCYAKYIK